MKKLLVILLAFLVCMFVNGFYENNCFAQSGHWQTIGGKIGKSDRWGSGWIVLDNMMDFKAGCHLRLNIGGTANKALIRFLEQGESPDEPVGIDQVIIIPKNRVVEIEVKNNYHNVIQVSVHGGPNPWGLYQLGGGNGPASLLRVEMEKDK